MAEKQNLDGLDILNIKNIDDYIIYELLDKIQQRIIIQREIISFNIYDLSGEYGVGYTSKGEEFYFDLEDYDKIKDYSWFVHNNGYLMAYSILDKKNLLMHRLIMNVQDKNMVDHINHRVNDNRKENLRIVNSSQNAMNTKLPCSNSSGYKGVSWDKSRNKWMASIKINGKSKNLGRFENLDDAIYQQGDYVLRKRFAFAQNLAQATHRN